MNIMIFKTGPDSLTLCYRAKSRGLEVSHNLFKLELLVTLSFTIFLTCKSPNYVFCEKDMPYFTVSLTQCGLVLLTTL
jgi:hypothetical protein